MGSTMSLAEFHLIPPPACKMASGLAAVAAEVLGQHPVRLTVSTSVPGLSFNVQASAEDLVKHGVVLDFVKKLEERPHVMCTGASLYIDNGTNQRPFEVLYTRQSEGMLLRIEKLEDKALGLPLFDSLHKHFNVTSKEGIIASLLPEAEQRALQFREEALRDLTSQVSRLGGFLTEMTRKNTEEIQKLTTELERKFQQKETTLQQKIQADRDELDRSRKEHDARVKEFETREYTFVRRKIDSQLKDLLKEQEDVKVSPHTGRKRWIIHSVCVLTLAASAVLVGYMAAQIVKSATLDWFHVLPFSFGAVAFASTLVFYLKWNNGWFRYLADAEFGHRKAKLDFARASWIAELLFEWKERKEVGVPDDVLRALTDNLFRPTDRKPDAYHPIDQIAALVGKTAKIKLGSIEIERAGRKAKTRSAE